MAAQRYGGRYSPDPPAPGASAKAPPAAPFRNRRARRVSLRARAMFLLPLPLLFAGIRTAADPINLGGIATEGGCSHLRP